MVGTGANTELVHCAFSRLFQRLCGPKVASPPRFSIGAGNVTFYVKHSNFEVLQKTPVTRKFSK